MTGNATLTRPRPGSDWRRISAHREAGYVAGGLGLVLLAVTLIANVTAADSAELAVGTLAWSFGLTSTAFGIITIGVALVVLGILVRIWQTLESVDETLPRLRGAARQPSTALQDRPRRGRVTRSPTAPRPTVLSRVAEQIWLPMLVGGASAVTIGLALSLLWADDTERLDLAAWTQGLQSLGQGLLLGGVATLSFAALGAVRDGGARIQARSGAPVETLAGSRSAKVAVATFVAGLAIALLQFVGYLAVARGVETPEAWLTWLGTLREFGLGLILAGIVAAVVALATVVRFQFNRIRHMVASGR